jgi:DNA-directed RNA polymerase subunit RPC12/RpoP
MNLHRAACNVESVSFRESKNLDAQSQIRRSIFFEGVHMPLIFIYRCSACGGETNRERPVGADQNEWDEIACPKCLEKNIANAAYLVFVRPKKVNDLR